MKHCLPCTGEVPPLKGAMLKKFAKELDHDWKVVKGHHLEKLYKFKNFKEAMAFTVKAGKVAEAENHHPDIYLAWGKVKITVWTHAVNGLTESDFVLAARIESLSH